MAVAAYPQYAGLPRLGYPFRSIPRYGIPGGYIISVRIPRKRFYSGEGARPLTKSEFEKLFALHLREEEEVLVIIKTFLSMI
jgi:hypothetical protein